LIIAGCGGGGGSTAGATAGAGAITPVGARKRGGTLRVVDQSLVQASTVDPNGTQISGAIVSACFAPLVALTPNMRLTPGLAETFEPDGSDMSKWTIRLRKGLEWHDDKPRRLAVQGRARS
jgi:ABC-type transport system substrate-binding protein